MNLKKQLTELDAQVASGDILGAFDHFFADACTTFSNEQDRTHSKEQKREALVWFLSNIERTNRIELIGQPVIEGDVSTSNFIFDFTNRQGENLVWNELLRRTWKGGLVVSEQYLTAKPAVAATPKSAKQAAPKTETTAVAPKASKAPVAAVKPAVKTAAKADDLTLVEGIGPKINELLNAAGITTFAQLAASKPAQVKAILDAAGPRFKMHDPATWTKQAALARDGKSAELKKLQDELKGGKIA